MVGPARKEFPMVENWAGIAQVGNPTNVTKPNAPAKTWRRLISSVMMFLPDAVSASYMNRARRSTAIFERRGRAPENVGRQWLSD